MTGRWSPPEAPGSVDQGGPQEGVEGVWVPGVDPPEWILDLLVAGIAGLLVLAFVFGLTAMLLRLKNSRVARRMNEAERIWVPLILEALEDPDRIEEVTTAVPNRDQEIFVTLLVRLSGRVRGVDRARASALAEPHLHVMLPRLSSAAAHRRALAVRALGVLAPGRYRDRLLEALGDPTPVVAMTAARVLARRNDPEAIDEIMSHLPRFHGWSRSFLASMIARGGPDALPTLRRTLTDPQEDPWIRAVAAQALDILDDPEGADLAARVLSGSDDRDLRVTCLRLVANSGRGEHLPTIRSLTGTSDFAVRGMALEALGRVGDESDLPILVEALNDPSPWVALRAGQAIFHAGGADLLRAVGSGDHARKELARQVLIEEGVEA